MELEEKESGEWNSTKNEEDEEARSAKRGNVKQSSCREAMQWELAENVPRGRTERRKLVKDGDKKKKEGKE
ncbi:hypothetical protein E2C01_098666 [Portunus trituberculatus]|uniref:Uncharacterized protein n=1 Tax=Portunus trituberculatus TaxID=210409 RepID=A0A5B7KDG9_PORTR|nr:hypothetical protein [Portunus trituberculatus]